MATDLRSDGGVGVMTPAQVNEAVGKKLGLDIRKCPIHLMTACCGRNDIPDYCGSIAAAWEIVEKCPMALVPFSNGHWYATTMDMPEMEGECFEIWTQSNCATKDECSCGRCAIADTAPMAICLAFLKLP